MDAAELDRIRRKVEQGEALGDDELERLRDAARAQPGPTLRLAVAHAMMNGGAERTALPLLEALVRDFPRDLQAWLGLARALLSLDRKGEGERALKEALQLSPGDPEAQKAMALLALGRGELAQARQWVSDVLRRDPFDSEARLLKEELEAPGSMLPPAAPEGREYALRPELCRALVSALRGRGAAVTLQADALVLHTPGGAVGRADLRSLYAAYLAGAQGLAQFVGGAADGLIAAARTVPGGREELLARVLPVLRPAGFGEVARGALSREGPAGLEVFYALEDPDYVRYLPAGMLEAHQLTVEDVDRAAFATLQARAAAVQHVQVLEGRLLAAVNPTGLWALAEEDGHDGARLLTEAQRARLQEAVGQGPWRVDLGRREAAVVARADDAAAVRMLRTLPPVEDGIRGGFVLHPDGRLERAED